MPTPTKPIGPRPSALAAAACVGLLPFLIAALVPSPASAQAAAEGSAPSVVSAATTRTVWVEARDGRGRTLRGLEPSDFEVLEDGASQPVRDVRTERPDARIALYFDAELSSSGVYRRSAEALAAVAQRLVSLGEVELVVADPAPETVLQTRDPLALGERLGWLGSRERGRQALLTVRDQVLRDLDGAPGQAPLGEEEQADRLRAAAEEERRIVDEQSRRLLAWAASRGQPGDDSLRLLFVVGDGFDLDPLTFYGGVVSESVAARALRGGSSLAAAFESTLGATARALGAHGWVVHPLAVASLETPETSPEAIEVFRPDGDSGGLFPGVVRSPQNFKGLFRRNRAGDDADDDTVPREAALLAPEESLDRMAQATGGALLRTDASLRDTLDRLDARVAVTYDSALEATRDVVPLVVSVAREGAQVQGARWAAAATPLAMIEARALRLVTGIDVDGGFDVAAAVELESIDTDSGDDVPASLEAGLSVRELVEEVRDGLTETDLRVTVVSVDAEGARLLHEAVLDQQSLDAASWRYATPLSLPPDTEQVAVLIESLQDGRWGGGLASVTRAVAAGGDGVVASSRPLPSVVEIEQPGRELLRGRVRFTARAYDERVRRIAFLLDEREVAVAERRPFSARVNLGRTPRRRELTAIAFGGDGAELGRSSVVLNAGNGGLGVDIVSPQRTQVTGPVDVEAEVTVPIERRLDRVLFFWNNQALSTLYAPPFRQRLFVPEDQPVGYVRVVAMLDDGTVAEDVVFLNGPDASETVNVDLVELYVVVTDRQGRPVDGLEPTDFRILEDGKEQRIDTFSNAGDLPLTLGMAIDSSASMFVSLPGVQRAAVRFLESTFKGQDRAFVVDFDSQPRLARGTTGELPRVVRAIEDLEANGRTALWESVVFSLVQLQGVRGRKALVVFSDGDDEDEEFPYRSCLKIARRMGVPIYLILMRDEPDPGDGLGLFNRSFSTRAQRLTEAVGGRVFYAADPSSLEGIYAQIERELRSQYLLAYYPPEGSNTGLWRDVEVDVKKRGLVPRTLSGYWQ